MTSIGHTPGEKWAFDKSVTDVFDDMLERSIPQYQVMRDACLDIVAPFIRSGTIVYDLGCSRAEVLVRMFERYGPQIQYVGIEVSEPMLEAARSRVKTLNPWVRVHAHDLRKPCRLDGASVVMSVLTLQFVPINYRQRIVADAYDGLESGGAFVVVEKVLGDGPRIDSTMVDIYHHLKMRNGYSRDDVLRKAMSLEGVLVPVSAEENQAMLKKAGFRQVDCFWRWMNFAGFIAIK